MPDMRKLMKQAQEMQEQIAQAQQELAGQEVEGTAGGGMVTVAMNGQHEVLRVKIQKQVVDPEDVEMLEDLIAAAVNEAVVKVQERYKEHMGRLTGGLGIPGVF